MQLRLSSTAEVEPALSALFRTGPAFCALCCRLVAIIPRAPARRDFRHPLAIGSGSRTKTWYVSYFGCIAALGFKLREDRSISLVCYFIRHIVLFWLLTFHSLETDRALAAAPGSWFWTLFWDRVRSSPNPIRGFGLMDPCPFGLPSNLDHNTFWAFLDLVAVGCVFFSFSRRKLIILGYGVLPDSAGRLQIFDPSFECGRL